MTVAFEELALLIDADQAHAAHRESGGLRTDSPDKPCGLSEEIQGDPR